MQDSYVSRAIGFAITMLALALTFALVIGAVGVSYWLSGECGGIR